jgi:hypothetical protein
MNGAVKTLQFMLIKDLPKLKVNYGYILQFNLWVLTYMSSHDYFILIFFNFAGSKKKSQSYELSRARFYAPQINNLIKSILKKWKR